MSRRALGAYLDLQQIHDLAETLGRPSEYGRTVEGRALRAYTIGDGDTTVWVTAGLHGLEYVGVATALQVLRRPPPPGVRLVVRPVLNPDAYARTRQQVGAGTVASMRRNANGVDLNRNFPLPGGAHPSRIPFAGAMDPTSATYRGPRPASEPEVQALMASQRSECPSMSLNLHSFMGTLIPARTWTWTDWKTYGTIARRFRRAQTGLGYRRLASPVFDVFTGELEDWQHHEAQCWAVCIECFSVFESFRQRPIASSAFERFNPANPNQVANRDADAIHAVMRSVPPRPVASIPGARLTASVPTMW